MKQQMCMSQQPAVTKASRRDYLSRELNFKVEISQSSGMRVPGERLLKTRSSKSHDPEVGLCRAMGADRSRWQ